MENLNFISDVTTWDSGGGMELDLITLKDGRVLVVSDEAVVLYESEDDVVSGEAKERETIFL